MNRALLTGNQAAAWGARLAQVEYVPAFPITPQTEIIETIGRWFREGLMLGRMTMLESEHSMLTAAGAAAATGVRTFTATSSQGLLYAAEMLYTIAGWRVPMVLVNVSRGLASPITLEPDHNDVMAARDCGFLQIHCATCQEVLDAVLIAHRWSETSSVRLPVLVNLDGFYLSFTREIVTIPGEEEAASFLPAMSARQGCFQRGEPTALASAVLGGATYSYFRYEMQLAALESLASFEQLGKEFQSKFGRSFEAVERYRMEDAEVAFFMVGSFATKAKAAVDRLRARGQRVGLVRPRLLRPYPKSSIQQALKGIRAVAVIDQNLSIGFGGVLLSELSTALYALGKRAPVLTSYIGGLGGRDIKDQEFDRIFEETKHAAMTGEAPPPRMLFTDEELWGVRKLQMEAGVLNEERSTS